MTGISLSIRQLLEADFDSADTILNSAFGTADSRLTDLGLYRQIEPEGLWLAEREAKPVGMVGAVNYGAFAYVGLMAVLETAQRQGIGLALMKHLLDRLEKQGVPLVLLDASHAGRPMYQKLGFMAYDSSHVFRCERVPTPECPPQVRPMSMGDVAALAEWDRMIFGADRGRLLRALLAAYLGRAFMLRDENGSIAGYVMTQANRIGPWVARSAPGAEALLHAALSLRWRGAVSVAVPGLNDDASALLRRNRFEVVRTNTHMGKGASEPPSQRRKIFGQTSLFFG